MLDGYQICYGDSNKERHIELIESTSSWIRYIPETIAECDTLECMDCRKSLVNCCTSDRSHDKCDFRDTLPKTIKKQSSIMKFI